MKDLNNIIIVNEFFSDNVGDQAIARGLKYLFTKAGYKVTELGFSAVESNSETGDAKGNKNQFKLKIKQLLKNSVIIKSFIWTFLNIGRVIRGANGKGGVAVIGGGQLIMEKSNFAIAMFVWVAILRVFGKKVYLLSVGLGEDFNKYEKFLYAISFKLVHRIYLRELAGIDRMQKIFGIHASYSPDAAYALPSVLDVNERNYTAVCITDYQIYRRHIVEFGEAPLSRTEYWHRWSDFINENTSRSATLKFMWTTETDKNETIEFIKCKPPLYPYTVFEGQLSLDSVLDDFSRAKSVLSGRMHGLILGHICGANPIPWLISKKIEHYSNEYLKIKPADLNLKLATLISELNVIDSDKQKLWKGN